MERDERVAFVDRRQQVLFWIFAGRPSPWESRHLQSSKQGPLLAEARIVKKLSGRASRSPALNIGNLRIDS